MLNVRLLQPLGSLISHLRFRANRLRLAKLIDRGLKVGKNVYVMEAVEFDLVYPFLIEIGDNCRISKGVRILAHDATTNRDLGVTRVAPVRILEGTFIGERAIIMPGVTLGPRAMIAAGSVVYRDIPANRTAAGNPARPYGTYPELLEKNRTIAKASTVFNRDDIENGAVTPEDIVAATKENGKAFVQGLPSRDLFYVNTDMEELRAQAKRSYNLLTAKHDVPDGGSEQETESLDHSADSTSDGAEDR